MPSPAPDHRSSPAAWPINHDGGQLARCPRRPAGRGPAPRPDRQLELGLVTGRLYWSDTIFEIFEIDPSQFGASYEAFLERVHPDDRPAVDETYNASVRNRTPYSITHRLLMPDGRVKHVHERGETFYDAAGSPIRSIGTVQDVTEQAVIHEELKRSRAALARPSASRSWAAGARPAHRCRVLVGPAVPLPRVRAGNLSADLRELPERRPPGGRRCGPQRDERGPCGPWRRLRHRPPGGLARRQRAFCARPGRGDARRRRPCRAHDRDDVGRDRAGPRGGTAAPGRRACSRARRKGSSSPTQPG